MFERITFDSNIMGGRACIRGTRIPVSVIVGQIAHGASFEEIPEGIGTPISVGAAQDAAPQDLDEIAGAVRSLCDLQRVIAYAPQSALVWRGKAWQTDFALWFLREIADSPAVNWIEPTSFRLDWLISPKVLDKDIDAVSGDESSPLRMDVRSFREQGEKRFQL